MKKLKLKEAKNMAKTSTDKELAELYDILFQTYPGPKESRHKILTRIWKHLKNETCMVKKCIIVHLLSDRKEFERLHPVNFHETIKNRFHDENNNEEKI